MYAESDSSTGARRKTEFVLSNARREERISLDDDLTSFVEHKISVSDTWQGRNINHVVRKLTFFLRQGRSSLSLALSL